LLATIAIVALALFYGRLLQPSGTVVAAEEYSRADRVFLTAATRFLLRQVQATTAARDRSTNEAISDFATQLLEDSSESLARLNTLIQESGISEDVAREPIPRERLYDLSGPAFDHAYLRFVINEHERAVTFADSQIKLGRNAAFLKFAAWLRGRAQHHLIHGYRVADAI
jgi:predicted outer membrane protein